MNSLSQEAIIVWAEYNLDRTRSKLLIDFGVNLLDKHDTDNIRILAGLDLGDSQEITDYFFRVIKELGLTVPTESTDLYLEYSKIICEQLLKDERKPLESLHLLSHLFVLTNCSNELSDFDKLDTDLMNVSEGYLFNRGLTLVNADSFIKRAAAVFLNSIGKQFPSNWHELYYCKDCQVVGKPKLKVSLKSLFAKTSHDYQICRSCGSRNLIYCDTIEGKEIFLRN